MHTLFIFSMRYLAIILPLFFSVDAAAQSLPVVHVQGTELVNDQGQPFRLLGVSASGTEDACIQNKGFSWGKLDANEAAGIASWRVNVVRVPLNEDCWLGINGAPAAYSGAKYQNAIHQWVNNLNKAGMIVILDLHWTAPGSNLANRQWPMADADHSITFWMQVAKTYASNTAIIFDVFNEPFIGHINPVDADWACWRDGCNITNRIDKNPATPPVTYDSAGMQQLIDAIRSTGATQPIMIGGNSWAGDPCGIKDKGGNHGVCKQTAYMPHDPLNQLILSFHTYNWTACTTEACWNTVAAAAKSVNIPLITGEVGERDCSTKYDESYLNWADKHHISYLAWSWELNSAKACQDLQLISNWNGTPATQAPEAAYYKDHLAQQMR